MIKLIEFFTFGLLQFCVVRQGEVRIIERRGKFARVAEPGVTLLLALWGYGEKIGRFTISAIDRDEAGRVTVVPRHNVEAISLRTQVDDYPKESVITRDNATVYIDAVVYYRLFDPEKAVYQVQDYVAALQKLVQSALRDECGKFELDELLVSRDKINHSLRVALDHATDPWGIKVDRVEIKDIDLGTFGQILAEQRAAETRRRTEITEAEGQKRAAVLRAEGESEAAVRAAEGRKQATILQAEAEREAAVLRANAQAEATVALKQAEAEGYALLKRALEGADNEALLRILALQSAATVGHDLANGTATKVFLPAEITSLFGLARPRVE